MSLARRTSTHMHLLTRAQAIRTGANCKGDQVRQKKELGFGVESLDGRFIGEDLVLPTSAPNNSAPYPEILDLLICNA